MKFMSPVSTRQANSGDLDALAPLFDAYRQFYGQDPNLHKARRFLAERLNRQESMVLLAADSGADTATACGPASNSEPPMASPNSPTCGHPKFPQARRVGL